MLNCRPHREGTRRSKDFRTFLLFLRRELFNSLYVTEIEAFLYVHILGFSHQKPCLLFWEVIAM